MRTREHMFATVAISKFSTGNLRLDAIGGRTDRQTDRQTDRRTAVRMQLVLDSVAKERLALLNDTDEIDAILQLVLNSCRSGLSELHYENLSGKLALDELRGLVEALVLVLTNSSRFLLTREELQHTLESSLSKDALDKVVSFNCQHHKEIRRSLKQTQKDGHLLPRFHRLSWRLQTQLAQRSLHSQSEVKVLLQFALGRHDAWQHVTISCTPAQVNQLRERLEETLQQAKGSLHKFTFMSP